MGSAYVLIDLNDVVCLGSRAKKPERKVEYLTEQIHRWVVGKGWTVCGLGVVAKNPGDQARQERIAGVVEERVRAKVWWEKDARNLLDEVLNSGWDLRMLFLISNDKRLVPVIRNCVQSGVPVWAAGTSMSKRLRKSATYAVRLYKCIPRYEAN